MPSRTERQRKFFGSELSRRQAGKTPKTDLTTKELRKFAKKPLKKGR